MAFVSAVLLKHHQRKLTEAERNFERLSVLGILNMNSKPTFECRANAASPLNVLRKTNPCRNQNPHSYVISIAHLHRTKDGTPYSDPKQEILIDTKNKTAETLSFLMSDLGACKPIYFKGKNPRATTHKENNFFLTQWLSTLIMQGFTAPQS